MPYKKNISKRLTISTAEKTYDYSGGHDFKEIIENELEVDSSDGFINLFTTSKSALAVGTLKGAKTIVLHNTGTVSCEIQLKYKEFRNNSNKDVVNSIDMGGGATTQRFATFIIPAGDFFYLPNARFVGYNADESGANAVSTTQTSVVSTLRVDSGVNLGADVDATTDPFQITTGADGTNAFRVGDLIQLGLDSTTSNKHAEILRVRSIDSTTTMTCDRALYGTSAGDSDETDYNSTADGHGNGSNIYLPIFNTFNDFEKYSTLQTDHLGRYASTNFFGLGRTTTGASDHGIVPGSVALKFFTPSYLEFGLTGIRPSTQTGLVASTTYAFDLILNEAVAKDSTANEETITFTTDASNLTFSSGTGSVLQKIQDQFDEKYYDTTSNLFEVPVKIGIVNGDVRITSGSRLSTSRVGVSNASTGTEMFGVGRMPAITGDAVKVRGEVVGTSTNQVTYGHASKVPNDTLFDKLTHDEEININAFAYDNGRGRISGACEGSINYETGAITISNGPKNANFYFYGKTNSVHAGGTTAGTHSNMIDTIGARSCNDKINGYITTLIVN